MPESKSDGIFFTLLFINTWIKYCQELLLFENGGTDDLERLVDSQFSKARVTMKFPWKDANRYVDVLNELEVEVKHIIGDQAEVTKTGLMTLLTKTIDNVMKSMTQSYTIAGVIITLLMILLIGNLKKRTGSHVSELSSNHAWDRTYGLSGIQDGHEQYSLREPCDWPGCR